MNGRVKWFSRIRRFGFINSPDLPGLDIFVHGSDITRAAVLGSDNLYEGERVEFEAVDNVIDGRYKGQKAINVRVIH